MKLTHPICIEFQNDFKNIHEKKQIILGKFFLGKTLFSNRIENGGFGHTGYILFNCIFLFSFLYSEGYR